MNGHILKPRKTILPLAEGLRWRGDGQHIFTRKYDGTFGTLDVQSPMSKVQCLLIGEWMRPKSGGLFTAQDKELFNRRGPSGLPPETQSKEFFVAHSVAAMDGQNLLREPAKVRWKLLNSISSVLCASASPRCIIAESGSGGEFVEAVIAAGGEGVCAVNAESPWGEMFVVKPRQEFKLEICGKDPWTSGVFLRDPVSGEARGKCPARSRFESLRIGQMVEVSALGLTGKGLLREARLNHQDSKAQS
jgi:hypothetical protein